MDKITTQKKRAFKKTKMKTDVTASRQSPSAQVLKNILNYSSSLQIRKIESGRLVEVCLN